MPQGLVERCLLLGCPEGRTVLDPFAGSGATALVARKLGMRAICSELNPGFTREAEQRLAREFKLSDIVDDRSCKENAAESSGVPERLAEVDRNPYESGDEEDPREDSDVRQ